MHITFACVTRSNRFCDQAGIARQWFCMFSLKKSQKGRNDLPVNGDQEGVRSCSKQVRSHESEKKCVCTAIQGRTKVAPSKKTMQQPTQFQPDKCHCISAPVSNVFLTQHGTFSFLPTRVTAKTDFNVISWCGTTSFFPWDSCRWPEKLSKKCKALRMTFRSLLLVWN